MNENPCDNSTVHYYDSLNNLYHDPEFRELEDEILAYWDKGHMLIHKSKRLLRELAKKYDEKYNQDEYLDWVITGEENNRKVRLVDLSCM